MFLTRSHKAGDKKTDGELITLYQSSADIEHLGLLYDRYIHLVYGVCLKYLKDEEESKDHVMQIFEKLIDSLKEHSVDNFKSWLHVLTKNHCLMTLRSAKKWQKVDVEEKGEGIMESAYELHHVDNKVDIEKDLEALKKCMEKLPYHQQQCVKLFYLDKKCYKEIEELTKNNLKKVKSYIQNGKRNLKLCVEKQHG